MQPYELLVNRCLDRIGNLKSSSLVYSSDFDTATGHRKPSLAAAYEKTRHVCLFLLFNMKLN